MEGNEIGGLIGGGLSLCATVGGYLLKSHNDRIKDIEIKQNAADKDLASHKLDSERRYAREETLQSSLARIHTRLDETASKDDIAQLYNNIKNFLGK